MGAYVRQGNLLVYSLTHAPTSYGSAMNQMGANNEFRNQQIALSQHYVSRGFNHPNVVLRIDWEFNGNWYPWSAHNANHLKQALIHCITNFRTGGLTQCKFDLCSNLGTHTNGIDAVFPGSQYIDIVATDHYDMLPPAYNMTGWNAQQNNYDGSLLYVSNFARQHGIMWALDEGGNVSKSSNNASGHDEGGDNVYYWQRVWEFVNQNAYNCHHHVTYDHPGAPADLRHDFASNPNSWAYYRTTWGGY